MSLEKRIKDLPKKKLTGKINIICDAILSEAYGDKTPTRVQNLWMAVVKRAVIDLFDPEVEEPDRKTAERYFKINPCHLQILNIDEEYFRSELKRKGFEIPERHPFSLFTSTKGDTYDD